MITVGIDMGAKYIKAVVLGEDGIMGRSLVVTEFDRLASAKKAYEAALKDAGIEEGSVDKIVATGAGKNVVNFADKDFTVMACDAKAMANLIPSVRTIIDVGAEEARAIKCDGKGGLLDFVINEKCAAGAGTFVEAMARALEVSIEEFGKLSLKSKSSIPINAQCVIFAESEVVSLIHQGASREDIAKAVHDAMASRVGAMAQRIRVEKDIALVGGVARNPGFLESLKNYLGEEILAPEDPEYVGAYGAALFAREI